MFVHPVEEVAERLAEMNNRKYGHYGIDTTAETYTKGGIWALKAPARPRMESIVRGRYPVRFLGTP